ncbi:uncharacterized protein H6S33_009883 [Morchella sextelata]|uniref:uncharacterized protein n=1 Tax=Morchella sextelata TaxID=1174677 RepID=UPI001D044046|nr:uncharacterized protein H6S33_009883 [Morchella sextelata]KAH0602242.1 hypothetical protein H6S33_009883 [Morchella sextelata]
MSNILGARGKTRVLIYRHQDTPKPATYIPPVLYSAPPKPATLPPCPPPTSHRRCSMIHPDTVTLGRLTTNANRPHFHYHDPLPPRPRTPERHTAYHTYLTETRRFTKGSHTSLAFHDLLRLTASTDTTTTATLTAPHATIHDLSNSDSWFRDACRNPATCLWLQETINVFARWLVKCHWPFE